jgi:hypothetical protein
VPAHRKFTDDLVQRLAAIGLGLDDPRERWRSFERFPAVLVCFESELYGRYTKIWIGGATA